MLALAIPLYDFPGDREYLAAFAQANATSDDWIRYLTQWAVGDFSDRPFSHRWLFAVSAVRGAWHAATRIDVPAATSRHDEVQLTSLSCGTAGDCAAGGFYGYSGFGTVAHFQAIVAAEAAGAWGSARTVPGTVTLNKSWDAHVWAVSCAPGGGCLAGGDYADHPHASKNHPFDVHAFLSSDS